jgi:hypothetical protein
MASAIQKKSAPEKEADKNAPIEFEFDGEKYTIPAVRNWPLKVARAQEAGRAVESIETLLGKDQMERFESKDRTMGDLEDLLEAAFAAVNLDPKE